MTEQAEPKRLGAFLGVFTPTVLTILGVIMFLRLGWLVAVAGLYGTLLIVVIANAITFLTALSVSALATNMRVGVGGAYFIISRSLGLEVGGAIGVPLFLSQVLSVTLYCYGLAEILRLFVPWVPVLPTAALCVVLVTLTASISVELTLKAQLPVMLCIVAAISSLLIGAPWDAARTVDAFGPWATLDESIGLFGAFAVFFPAVTGILAGVSLSGDLEDPGRAIPVGVLGSVVVGFVVYMVVPVALSGAAPREVLLDAERLIWFEVAQWPVLVAPGLIGAVLSSAYGSILGAPRTLQALAADDIVPRSLGEVHPESKEPLFAMYISGALAFLAVGLGDLNSVATSVTIFFLTTYGALNLVAMIEVLVAEPSYRPRIHVPWWCAMLGAVGCVVTMALISPMACFIAVFIEACIFFWLRRRSIEAPFGDARTGLMQAAAHELIVWFTNARHEARNWRPNVLVCTDSFERDIETVRMANQFNPRQGLLTVVALASHDLDAMPAPAVYLEPMRERLREESIDAFVETVMVPELNDEAYASVAQAHGFGGMNANTVLYPWNGDIVQLQSLLRRSRHLRRLEKCTVLFRASDRQHVDSFLDTPRIIIWWKGLESNGDLMLLLAHLISLGDRYGDADILLKTVVADQVEAAAWNSSAEALISKVRMAVKAEPIVNVDHVPIGELIRTHSSRARLVFLGLPAVENGHEKEAAEGIVRMVDGLPDTLLVRNDGPFRGRLI